MVASESRKKGSSGGEWMGISVALGVGLGAAMDNSGAGRVYTADFEMTVQ